MRLKMIKQKNKGANFLQMINFAKFNKQKTL